MQRKEYSATINSNRQMHYDYDEKSNSTTARNAFTRPPYSQNKTRYSDVLAMFHKYPKGTQIRLAGDYPQDVHIVHRHYPLFNKWYIEFEDGHSVCMDRLDALVEKERV